jgi:hypothetical protein
VLPGFTRSTWSGDIQPNLIFVKEEIPCGGFVFSMKC